MSPMIEALLNQARQYAQHNDKRAELAFANVLENDAFNVEARTFLARVAMQSGQAQKAFEHLQIATRVNPTNAALWRSLGVTHIALSQWLQAQEAFEHCLKLAPNMHAARLHLGKALEKQGKQLEASKTYIDALSQAQRDGLWRDANSTPPWLLNDVIHANTVASKARDDLYQSLMQPLYAQFDKQDLSRVDQCVKSVLGLENSQPSHSKQKPTFMYFPGLPEAPVFDHTLFSWFEQLENSYAAICKEAENIVDQKNGLKPFLELTDDANTSDYLGGEKPNWDAYFFYRHGEKFESHHLQCPATSAALEALPLVRIAEHAPEICFSMLSPDTHILPHYGTSNIRCVVHLPLIVPDHCALKVLDPVIEGKAGKCFAFDDTFLHEAWNRSEHPRTILLMDAWNPYLTDVERLSLTSIVQAIGQFYRH
jgi:aspartate beta-hydroxylase